MLDDKRQKKLREGFRTLDHRMSQSALKGQDLAGIHGDDLLISAAFGLFACGRMEEGDGLLARVLGDGSAPVADLAYIRAFRHELAGDLESVVRILEPHLDSLTATHGARSRLRVADALVSLGRYPAIAPVLKPLLSPPGVPETLEAQLILLEAMIRHGSEKEKLIEQVSLIDLLLERGFRLKEGENAVYYARLAEEQPIEPLVGPLLSGHEVLLDFHVPDSPEEIEFLLSAGDKYKVPSAVRASARGYVKQPYKFGELDPERACYLYASHEEHEAARLVILGNHTRSAIQKNGDLWGVLLLESYHAGKWREVLELLREHRREIQHLPRAAEAAVMRPVCEFHLGRHAEALQHIGEIQPVFDQTATPAEAGCEALACLYMDDPERAVAAGRRIFAARSADPAFSNEYATMLLNGILIRSLDAGLIPWLVLLTSMMIGETRQMNIQRIGEVLAEWSHPEAVAYIASQLEAEGGKTNAALLRGIILAQRHEGEAAEAAFRTCFENPEAFSLDDLRLYRARSRRRLGNLSGALEDARSVAENEQFPRPHVAHALIAGLLAEMGRESDFAEELAKAEAAARRLSRSREEFAVISYEIRQLVAGDAPAAILEHLESMSPGQRETVETPRLARKVLASPDATETQRAEANAILNEWKAGLQP